MLSKPQGATQDQGCGLPWQSPVPFNPLGGIPTVVSETRMWSHPLYSVQMVNIYAEVSAGLVPFKSGMGFTFTEHFCTIFSRQLWFLCSANSSNPRLLPRYNADYLSAAAYSAWHRLAQAQHMALRMLRGMLVYLHRVLTLAVWIVPPCLIPCLSQGILDLSTALTSSYISRQKFSAALFYFMGRI